MDKQRIPARLLVRDAQLTACGDRDGIGGGAMMPPPDILRDENGEYFSIYDPI